MKYFISHFFILLSCLQFCFGQAEDTSWKSLDSTGTYLYQQGNYEAAREFLKKQLTKPRQRLEKSIQIMR